METATFFNHTKPKAKKTHNCVECKGVIQPGEVYHKFAGVWCGDFEQYVTCVDCEELRTEINNDVSYDDQCCFTELGEYVFEIDRASLIQKFVDTKKKRGAKVEQWMLDRLEDAIEEQKEIILQNAVKITDGDKIIYIRSRNTHDYVNYKNDKGEWYAVDGGPSYIRRGFSKNYSFSVEDYNLRFGSTDEEFDTKLLWKPANEETKPLCQLTTEHLIAILNTQAISETYKKTINRIIKNRESSNQNQDSARPTI